MKHSKRFLSILIVLTMCMGLMPCFSLTTYAADADTSWYSDSYTSFTLYDAADLAGLASLVNAGNNFEGKTIVLGNSIDLNNEEWTPIGTIYKQFNGSFDGNNKKINNLTISSSLTYVGLFGVIGESSTIMNLTVSGSLNSEYDGGAIGGIVARNYGMVSDCVYSGTVSGSGRIAAGGIVGYNNEPIGKVTNCINTGTVSNASYVGGIVGYNYGGTLSNNYYLSDTADTATGQTAKTLTDFASGEVTYLLNSGTTDGTQAWYQTLGTDSYPVLDSTHGTVYYGADCARTIIYSNSLVSQQNFECSYDEYGFCTICGGYQSATLNSDGIYEISNAGQLFWFASLVNGDTTQEGITAVVADANAILTANIDLESKEWTPIGDYSGSSISYSGTFDGDGHTVKGLYINSSSNYQGLFGQVSGGTVQNVTVSGNVIGSNYVGGVVGNANKGNIITNCSSDVSVSGSSNVGGVIGSNWGTVTSCINSGEVSGSSYVGGVVGSNWDTAANCINNGEVSGSSYVGGVVGRNISTLKDSYNIGTVNSTGDTAGGVVGYNYVSGYTFGTVSNCYYLDSTASAAYGTNIGTIGDDVLSKTTTEFASGEVTYLLNGGVTDGTQAWYQTIGTDAYPQLTSETSKKVILISICKSTNGNVILESYINPGDTLSTYPTGDEYTFYSDSALTQEISDISTATFDTDTSVYVVTAHDLTIIESNGGVITEDTDYTYENKLLTVLTGGEYTISGTSTTDTIKVDTSDDVTITLTGVSITNDDAPPVELTGTGTVTVKLSGTNTLTSTNYDYAGLQLSSTDLIITSAAGDGETSGSLTATGGDDAAGIGSGDGNMNGSITINGGTVSGISPANGAGIGGSGYLGGNITINGGAVSGRSNGYGAGIGSGTRATVDGNIIINGGTVSGTSSLGGAGIGSGYSEYDDVTSTGFDSLFGNIEINGGTVSGMSGGNGAGIGTGSYSNFRGSIIVTGGTVSGNSLRRGAGLGAGYSGSVSGSVNISGGYITAASESGDAITQTNAAISGGYFADSGYSTSTVYGVTLSSSYEAYENTDATSSGTYPCYVAAHTHTVASYDEYGFCTICGGYQPATINSEGVYEISNAGQMYWFASLVNGDTTQEGITAANTSANAVLTADIDLSVTTDTHTSIEWTPVGTKAAPYTGTFDGNGKTISGMSIKTASTYMGLFGYVSAGTIKDLTVSGEIDVSGNSLYAGGIVGTVSKGTLSNLTSEVSVTANDGTKGTFGGIAATVESGSTMELCVNNGTVTASGVLDCVGGLVGYMNSATIINSINYGEVDTTGGTAKASTSDNTGIYTGGIIGYINNAAAFVTNCVNLGTIKGAGDNTDDTCYNGAVVGRVRSNLGGITNVFYLDTSADAAYGENESGAELGITVQTAEKFATGAAAWSLQNANTDYVWGQTLGTDDYPVLTSEESKKVVKVTFYKSTTGLVLMESYTNADGTLSSYLTGSDYTFYSDFDLTNEISDIGTLTFDTDTDIYVVTDHDLTILETNGGTIREGTDYTYDDNLLTVLTGGTYTISGTSATDTIKVTASGDVAITLYGVNITSDSKPPMEITGTGTVTVKLSDENTLTVENSGGEKAYAGLQKTSTTNELIITSADGDGKTTGKLNATGGTHGAGIGSGNYADFGSITIKGGTITAIGSTYSAGIGSGLRGSGTVTVTGGDVTAYSSGGGAGIGSGNGGSNGIVTITGGKVNASSNTGAAIGGGQASDGTTTVNISGGYISVSTNNSNADYIGSGYLSTSTDTVTITGGYFADSGFTAGAYGTGKVYGCNVADGYTVYANVEDTKGDYPARVLPTTWTANVTYNTSGANGTAPSDDTDYGYGAEVTVDATLPLKKDGYAQTGWSLSSTDTAAVTTFNISGDTTLYPVFARQFTDSGASDISLTYGEAITAIDLSDYIEFVDDTTFTSTSGEFTFALASGSELPAGLTLNEGVITGTPTAATEAQSVSFTVTDKTPYIMLASLDSNPATVSATLTLTFTVAKAASSVDTAPTAVTGLTYNGSAQELVSAGTASGGEMQYSMSESGTYSADIPTATNAGTYTVYYKAVGDSNHSDTAAASVSVTIAELPIELTWDYTSFVYDGKEKSVTATITNAVGDDVVNPTYDGTTSATDVGSYTAEVSSVSNTNYTLTGATGLTLNWSIVQSATGGDVKTYNGDTLTNAYTYGDTITVKATLEATGTASGLTVAAFTPITTAMAAVYNGTEQISDAVAVTNGTEITLTVDTTDLGASDSAYTLTLKYYGDDNMATTELNFNVTIAKATPDYTKPTGLTATYGDTLSSVTLPDNWAWVDENMSVGDVGTHEFEATFSPDDTDNYETVTETLTVTVSKTKPSYEVPSGLTATYGDTLNDVTLPAGWTWDDDTSTSVGDAGTSIFSATYTPDDTTNYESVTVNVSVTVEKATPTYELPTGLTATYGDSLASVELPDGWAWADATSNVGDAGNNIFTAVYTPEDSANYNTATEILTVSVAKAEQITPTGLTVTQPDEQTSTGTITGVTADMEYSTDNGDTWEEITDDTLIIDPGTVLIRYAETENYNASAAVEITIDAANPSYTTPTDLTAVYGDILADVELPDADNGVWTWLDENASVGNAGTNTFTAIFTPYDDNYNTVYVEVSVTVEKSTPDYTEPTGLTATYGDTLATVALPDGWAWTDATANVGNAGTNTFTAVYTPEDSTNYETVTAEIDVNVSKATPTYELPIGLTATYGDTLASVELPDNWAWVDESASVGDAGTHEFAATYTPDDTDNYETVTAEISVTVSSTALTVSETPTAARVKRGNTLSKSTLSGGSVTTADGTEISGTWTWSDGTETMSKTGTYERTAVFTADDEAYGTIEATVTVTVYTSGGGGGGSSSSTTTYAVTSEELENGDVSFNSSNAQSGATVTITVTPDDGYETESITVTDASGNDIEVTANDDGTYSFTMPSSKVSVNAEFKEVETDTESTTEPTTEPTDDTHDCPSEKFTDVDTSLWYHEYIDYVLENGLMNGTGDTTFEPNTTTTRAMIVTVLYRLEGEPTASNATVFTDVAVGDWYANAVAWAAENGIVLGYGDGTFGANDVITREQTAAILYRYADYKGEDTSVGEDTNILSYTDADEISEYAIPAMQWAVGTGLVTGKGDNVLDPLGGATRAETAAMLERFIEAE